MIKLSTTPLLCRLDNDEVVDCPVDRFHDQLWQACREAGHDDLELTDDVMNVVEDFIMGEAQRGVVCSIRDINALIVQMLGDCGLVKVAACYMKRYQPAATVPDDSMIEAERSKVSAVLMRDVFFQEIPLGTLLDYVMQAVHRAGVPKASPAFYVELAKSIWLNQPRAQEETRREGETAYWVLHRTEIADLIEQQFQNATYLQPDVIGVRSVSMLFPVIHFSLNLDHVSSRSSGLLTELEFYPAFEDLSNELGRLIDAMRDMILCRLPYLGPDNLAVRIHLSEPAQFSSDAHYHGLPARRGFYADLQGILQRSLPECAGVEVIYSL